MRRASRYGAVGCVLFATLLLAACVPSEAEIVGRWESADSAVVVFADDGTFAATGLEPHVLLPMGAEREHVPDDLAGTWYVESPVEDVCEPGDTIKISWRTEPVEYSDAFCLIGRGANALLAVPTHHDDGSSAYLDFVRD
jgi:hypothetical protein